MSVSVTKIVSVFPVVDQYSLNVGSVCIVKVDHDRR